MVWTIIAKDLWFKYSSDYVLREANIRIDPCIITAIVGATGSGKTTLLFLLSGLLEPTRGEIYYNGKPLREILPATRKHIGILFQDPSDQLFNSTVYDEIAYSLRTLGLHEDVIKERVLKTAEILGLGQMLHKRPYTLSLGEKKKVALASIIVYDPDILFLDEPLANLDYNNSSLLERLILNLKKQCKNIVITTHSIEFALRVGDVIYSIVNGRLIGPFDPLYFLEKGILEARLPEPLVYRVCRKLRFKPVEVLKLIRDMEE